MKRPNQLAWLILLAVPLLLGVWQVVAMSGPNRDDEAAEKLRGWGASVVRNGRLTPSAVLSGGYTDERGNVQAVHLKGVVTAEHVEVLLSLRQCEILFLHHCTFTEPDLLGRLAAMPALRSLMLWHNTVTDDDLIRALPHFSKLESLYLQDNNVTDAVIDAIAGMPRLRWVEVGDTKITSAGIVRLQQLRPSLRIEAASPAPY